MTRVQIVIARDASDPDRCRIVHVCETRRDAARIVREHEQKGTGALLYDSLEFEVMPAGMGAPP